MRLRLRKEMLDTGYWILDSGYPPTLKLRRTGWVLDTWSSGSRQLAVGSNSHSLQTSASGANDYSLAQALQGHGRDPFGIYAPLVLIKKYQGKKSFIIPEPTHQLQFR